MKHILFSALAIVMISIMPVIVLAQKDTTSEKMVAVTATSASPKNDTDIVKKDTLTKSVIDTTVKAATDTVAAVKINVDTAVVAVPMNCYKQYIDYFTELGTKPVADGMQLVVFAYKKKESCNCLMGRVEVSGGKIKAPLYIQTEGGDYKTFGELGKKLDPDFIAAVGDGLWTITNGMSVVFQTTDQEYGRVFFYKFLNKNKGMSKEAPSPADLLKN